MQKFRRLAVRPVKAALAVKGVRAAKAAKVALAPKDVAAARVAAVAKAKNSIFPI
jgi:hypothetical protein